MKPLKQILGVLLGLLGLAMFFGKGKNPDGSAVTFWQHVQDHLGVALLLLIGASLIISATRKKDEK